MSEIFKKFQEEREKSLIERNKRWPSGAPVRILNVGRHAHSGRTGKIILYEELKEEERKWYWTRYDLLVAFDTYTDEEYKYCFFFENELERLTIDK